MTSLIPFESRPNLTWYQKAQKKRCDKVRIWNNIHSYDLLLIRCIKGPKLYISHENMDLGFQWL